MIKYNWLVVLLFMTYSCNTEEYAIHNLNGNKISVFGHGGMGSGITYPSNTSESILKCLSLGADGSEIDVQLTKDSVLIAFHDHDLGDNTNLSGRINSMNWEEIKGAYYTNIPFLKYDVISLDELFSSIDNLHDYQFTFDCKLLTDQEKIEDYYHSYINALARIIKKHDLLDNVLLESQDELFLSLLQNSNADYKLFIYPTSFESGLAIAKKMKLYGITISTNKVSKEQIEIAHKNNFRITIWSVNSRNKNRKGVRKNPDFIQTDRLSHLISIME